MKKIIIAVIAAVICLGAIQVWGANTFLLFILCISTFLAGLFIGQRRKHA